MCIFIQRIVLYLEIVVAIVLYNTYSIIQYNYYYQNVLLYPLLLLLTTTFGSSRCSSNTVVLATIPIDPLYNKKRSMMVQQHGRILQQEDVVTISTTSHHNTNTPSSTFGSSSTTPNNCNNSKKKKKKLVVLGIDGGTESIRACFFDAMNGNVIHNNSSSSCGGGGGIAVPYITYYPKPSYAEQDPNDWWKCCGEAVRRAIQEQLLYNNNNNDNIEYEICGITIDTTCCSVVILDQVSMIPKRNCLLWMDQRSVHETQQIMDLCSNGYNNNDNNNKIDHYHHPAIAINNNGTGPISAEWLLPKVLWIKQNEPHIYESNTTTSTTIICEYQDYMNYQFTDILCSSTCNTITRWHYNGSSIVENDNEYSGGQPLSLYDTLHITELRNKLPKQNIPMGTIIGTLTKKAAEHLGILQYIQSSSSDNNNSNNTSNETTTTNIPVVQGGPDAFVGMIGLGCIESGQLCLITGSSHLHCVITSQSNTAPGIWGAYTNAPLIGMNFAEGGQSSTGSILRWAKRLFGGIESFSMNNTNDNNITYKLLDKEAEQIAPGSDGLMVLETFQGSRTPITDPFARGAIIGLTLSHTRAHIWRALMESVCYGTRACIEGLEAAGHVCEEIIIAGGVTNSDIWLQMHADITNKTITLCENSDAPLLGCAILASTGVGIHNSISDAVRAMVRTNKKIIPNTTNVKKYDVLYNSVYKKMLPSLQPMFHSIHNIRGGADVNNLPEDSVVESVSILGSNNNSNQQRNDVIVAPSLLACDWANIEREVHRCCDIPSINRLHIDIFDGVYLNSPTAFTFGPQMVVAIRNSIQSYFTKSVEQSIDDNLYNNSTRAISMDLHLCVDRPHRFVQVMADAVYGNNSNNSIASTVPYRIEGCFIFQWEAMEHNISSGIQLIEQINYSGMKCGISINPSTNVQEIYPLLLLSTTAVHVVNVLGVEPGYGGQTIQMTRTIQTIQLLKEFRLQHTLSFDIMVDGGINDRTSNEIFNATGGVDVVIAGTFLFQHTKYNNNNLMDGIMALTNEQK